MENFTQYSVFHCLSGSYAYGTQTSSSDRDTRGVFIAPPAYVLSCVRSVEQMEISGEDTVFYELRKFLKLATDCSPNIIELLFTEDENVLFIDWPFAEFRKNKHLFLSKKAKHTFSGYAMAQMKRIKGHNKHIQNPKPENAPRLSDFCRFIDLHGNITRDPEIIREMSSRCFLAMTFGSTQFRVYTSPKLFAGKNGFFDSKENQPKYINVDDEVLSRDATFMGFLWINVDEYKVQYREWKEYWEWKKNRNPVRAALEEKFHFDAKHALHLVRLMSMAKEILTEGKVIVRRPDAAHLLDIRNGKFDYDWLMKWAEDTDNELNELYESSTLPFAADMNAIDDLYREVVMKYWKEKKLIEVLL